MRIGLMMEEMIFNLADTHLFFNDLEVWNCPFCVVVAVVGGLCLVSGEETLLLLLSVFPFSFGG